MDGRTRVGKTEDGKKKSQSCESSERKEKATAANSRHGTPGHAKSTQGQSLVCNVDPNTLRQDAAKTEQQAAESSGNQRGLDRSIHPDDSSSKQQTEVKEENQTRHSRGKNACSCLTIFPQSPKLNIWTIAAFLSLITCCSSANTQSLDQKHQTHCMTTGATFENESTNITCHFPKNVRDMELNIEVIKYDFDKSYPLRDLISSCIWNEKQNYSCALKAGYEIDVSAIGDTATLTIVSVQKEHAGTYFCGDQTAVITKQKECTLAIKGSRISCSVAPATLVVGDPASITCHYNSNLTRSREAFYITRISNSSNADDILFCAWDSEGRVSCNVNNDFTFDNTSVSTSVRVNITSAEQVHSGTYWCNTVSYDKRLDVSSCSLKVTGSRSAHSPATGSAGITKILPRPVPSETKCQSEKQVPKGKSTTMTFLIPKNIDSQTADIHITKSKSTDGAELEVMRCNGSSTCSEEDGYRLVEVGTKTMVVKILNVTEKHEGKFLCTFKANAEWETATVCLQTLKENNGTSGASRLFPTTPCAEMAAHLAKVIFLPLLSLLLVVF